MENHSSILFIKKLNYILIEKNTYIIYIKNEFKY